MHKTIILWATFIVVALLFSGCSSTKLTANSNAKIVLENYAGGETIRYSVPIIRGLVSDASVKEVYIMNKSLNEKDPNYKIQAQLLDGKFKGISYLIPGTNKLQISAGKSAQDLIINYKPQTNPYMVRMVYFTDKTGNTIYETPIPNDNQNYRGKFDTGLKLMQSFTAERMNDLGHGRKTFNFEADANGMANVYVVTGALSEAEYNWMPRHKLYGKIKSSIDEALPKGNFINLATVAFSKHDTNTQRNTAYTALGGGNLALFGGAIMYTWPNSLSNAQDRLMDDTAMDTYFYAHDDKSRQRYWATTATTMGAALHEMGHAFGLPHSKDPMDIMTRGMDHFNRVFVFQDAPSAKNDNKYVTFADDQIAYFAPESAAALAPTRSFALDAKDWGAENTIKIDFDSKTNKIIVESQYGLAFIGYEEQGIATDFIQPCATNGLPKNFELDMKDVIAKLPTLDKIQIRVRDVNGDMGVLRLIKKVEGDQTTWTTRKASSSW